MKFLVIGLGSMGKRRIRCLKALGYKDIAGYDPRKDRTKEVNVQYGICTYSDFDEAMSYSPEAVIISTPPDKHMQYAIICAKRGIHFFTEASVVDGDMELLIQTLQDSEAIGAPSCTMRFYPAIKLIKKLIDENAIGKLSTFTYHSGQYLPDWHPWESINDFYVSKRETGGCREIVSFELCWLIWVFGKVKEVSGICEKTISLTADIADVYQVLIKFDSGFFGHLLVDVVSRSATRKLRIVGEEGTIEWDWDDSYLRLYSASKGKWDNVPYQSGNAQGGYNKNLYEEMYIEELSSFINAAKGIGTYDYDYCEDKSILNILYNIEKSPLRKVDE